MHILTVSEIKNNRIHSSSSIIPREGTLTREVWDRLHASPTADLYDLIKGKHRKNVKLTIDRLRLYRGLVIVCVNKYLSLYQLRG